MKIGSTFPTILMTFFVSLIGFDSILLGQGALIGDNLVGGAAKETTPDEATTTHDDESVFGLNEDMSERLLSSLRKGAFDKNETVCYQSLLMFSKHPELHRKLGEGVQLELVKQSLERDITNGLGFEILVQSEIGGIERQELLLDFFKSTFRSSRNSRLERQSVLQELIGESEAIVERFASEIDQEPLGEHADKLLVIEHLGPFAEKALPALLKRYRAVKEIAAKEGRLPNYMDLLFTIGEIQSKDAMEIILDACAERGSDERIRYAVVGFECLNRVVAVIDEQVIGKRGAAADPSAYKKYAQALMKKYDSNSDGLLTRDEIAKMRTPVSMNGDRNRDGRLTETELLRGIYPTSSRSSRSSSRSRSKELIRNSVNLD